MTENQTTAPAPTFAWVFDSRKCRMLGHKLGCQAVPVGPIGAGKGSLIFAGIAAEASEIDDLGHPVSFCKCTKGGAK